MRTLGTRTHLLLAIAAAIALIGSLRLPWYGAAPPSGGAADDLLSRADTAAAMAARVLGERSGTTGWDALAGPDAAVAGVAGAVIVLLVLSLVPRTGAVASWLARLGSSAALGVVFWRLVDGPPGLEPRVGLLAALLASAMLLTCAAGVAPAPRRRAAPALAYAPPPPPVYDATASYGPPQY